jgi:uncharacterized protein
MVPPLPPELPVSMPPVPELPPTMPEPSSSAGFNLDFGQSSELIAPSPEQKTFSIIMHLSPIIGMMLSWLTYVPFLGILAPLGLWLWKREESAFLDRHGKEALNFCITASLAGLIALPTVLICIGALLVPAIFVTACVFNVIGAVKASEGKFFRYPYCLRLIK